jgi:hypothetical protein
MRRSLFWGALICAQISCVTAVAAAVVPVAHAADGGAVTVPWGDWAAEVLIVTAGLLIGWVGRAVPAAVRQWAGKLLGDRVDQLLERAIQYGINAVAGAVRGKTLSLDTGLDVANQALNYAVRQAPKLVDEIGVGALRDKILARLDLDEAASIVRTRPLPPAHKG